MVKALRGFAEIEKIDTTNRRWDLVAELSTEALAGLSQALDQISLIEGIAATETSILLATIKTEQRRACECRCLVLGCTARSGRVERQFQRHIPDAELQAGMSLDGVFASTAAGAL